MNCIYGVILVAALIIFGWIVIALACNADRPKCKCCWTTIEASDLIEGRCPKCGEEIEGLGEKE